jgi:hypothetical protein
MSVTVPMILLATCFVVTVLHVTMAMYLEYYIQTYHPELWAKFWGKSVAGKMFTSWRFMRFVGTAKKEDVGDKKLWSRILLSRTLFGAALVLILALLALSWLGFPIEPLCCTSDA